MIDDIFVLYENNGKYFSSYEKAYFNSKQPMSSKTIHYVFTPTMQLFKRVGELENAYRSYFNRIADCDYFNIYSKTGTKQLKLIGEL